MLYGGLLLPLALLFVFGLEIGAVGGKHNHNQFSMVGRKAQFVGQSTCGTWNDLAPTRWLKEKHIPSIEVGVFPIQMLSLK